MEATMGDTETKGMVRSKAIRVATLLRNRGIEEGNIIVISSKNHLDQTVALLACWFLGAIVAPLHSDYDYEDLKHAVRMLQPKVAFCGNKSSILLHRIMLDINVKCTIITFNEESKQFPTFKKCCELYKEDPNFEVAYISEPSKQPAIIITTLGTETNCKLVAVSHYNLILRYSRLIPRFNKSEKLLSFFPLSCTMHILASCLCFDTTVRLIYFKHFTEKSICKHIQHLKVEHMFIDGELVVKVVANAPLLDYDLTSLKTIFVAGMPLSTTNYAKVCRTFRGVDVNTTYQTIETGMMTEIGQEVFSFNKQKVLSVGKLYPGLKIKILDIRTKQVLGAEQSGEIYVKGAAIMLGYYRDPLATSKAFVKGFYKTGDVGSYDTDGYVYIKGRLSDHVYRSGFLFGLQDIEEVLKLNQSVSEVVCIETFGAIIACVIKKLGHEIKAITLLDFVYDVLPPYKIPSRVIFQDYFPKTVLGVNRKNIIKENITKILLEESLMKDDSLRDDKRSMES
ncbi:uncharacterized protein [Onthophagus taurus]|nr:4-coumarate--CoA ligase-like 9 isoform X2 [Onthophagus taurus]